MDKSIEVKPWQEIVHIDDEGNPIIGKDYGPMIEAFLRENLRIQLYTHGHVVRGVKLVLCGKVIEQKPIYGV